LKIVFLTNQFYLHGSIEKMLAKKLNYLEAVLGYEVILCTTEHKGNPFVYPVNNNVRHVDLWINYHREKSYFHPKNLWKSIAHYRTLRSFLESEQPDVVVSVNYTPEQFLLPFICKHIPKVKEFHSSGVSMVKPTNLPGKLKHRLFKIFGKYDALVVLNDDECNYYPFTQLHVIPNFISIPKETPDLAKEKTILAAGRIAPVKQFGHLVQAWSLIADQHPDWEVKIFGDGDPELTRKLEDQINALKISTIRLMGSTAQLDTEMQKASIYAMTSSTECFPMVLLEAQAVGLPIVSYDCPHGPRNIVTHEVNGLLTPSNEIPDFAEALNSLINNKDLRKSMGETAKENIKIYDEEQIMQQWVALFTRLKIQKDV
jgi:glycosyltransferase involved in cell wall biosynthesis